MITLKHPAALLAILVAATALGCGKESTPPTPTTQGAHDDHDHAGEAHDDHDHGAETQLGAVTIGAAVLSVSIAGAIEPSAELHVEIEQTAGPAPSALRLWIGDAAATGAAKTKADAHDNHFHAHAETPATLAPDAALWIELEAADGTRTTASLPLKR